MKMSAAATAVSLVLAANYALAQESQPTKDEQEIEVINITGTNIKGVDLEGSQPLRILDAEDIAKSGAATIADLMRTVSQTRGGVGSFNTMQSGATSTSTPPGQAAASLRGIGPSSTLTLINGRRVAASSFASGTENFVDINSIPASAVKRVEILATGASAIYGADAVAGVINYILKDNYEGLDLTAAYENTTDNDNHGRINLQLLWGTTVAGGNLTVFADYYDRKSIHAQDFDATRNPVLANSYSYLPSGTPNIYFFSARDGNEIGAPNCATPLVTTEFGEEICAYYGNEHDFLETPLESFSGGFTFNKSIGDIDWHTDFMVSHTSSTSISTPAPINLINDAEGPWVQIAALDVFDDVTRDQLLDNLYVDPFDTQLGRELEGFRYDARFSDPRTVDIDTTAFRLVSSLAGDWGEWSWESGVTLSRSESEQEAVAGIYNRYRYTAAVDGELCSDGSIASYDADADTLNCGGATLMPFYNPFLQGDGTNDQTLALAQSRPTRDGDSTVYGIDFKVSGSLMEWGEDYIRMAAGVEFRREEITDSPSLEAQARADNAYLVDVFGFGSSVSSASRNQYGAFAEFYIPVSDQVELNIAGRFDDYNDFGSTFNPKVGITYRPIDSLVIRGSWSTAFRAPSLTQAGVQLRTTRADFDCGASQAVADLYCEGDATIRGNNVLELGNPSLRAEEAETLSVGLAFSPTDKTLVTLDYWQFEHEELVDTNMTGVLVEAMTNADLRHCGLVPEGEQGIAYNPDLCLVTDTAGRTIEEDGANLGEILDAWVAFDDPRFQELPLFRDHVLLLDNTGTQELRGIDFNFEHEFDFGDGALQLGLEGTHYLDVDRNIAGSDQIESLAGTFQYPETIATAELFWVEDDWYAGAYVYFTGRYEDDIDRLRGREIDEVAALGLLDENGQRDVSSWTTLSLSAGYHFKQATVRLTVDNVFDRDAPLAFGSARGFDAFNHDPFGTQYRLSVTAFFE